MTVITAQSAAPSGALQDLAEAHHLLWPWFWVLQARMAAVGARLSVLKDMCGAVTLALHSKVLMLP